MLDFTGSIASFTQAVIDDEDGKTPELNKLKVILAVVVAFYDVILLYQHFVLYGDKKKTNEESLLRDPEGDFASQSFKEPETFVSSDR